MNDMTIRGIEREDRTRPPNPDTPRPISDPAKRVRTILPGTGPRRPAPQPFRETSFPWPA